MQTTDELPAELDFSALQVDHERPARFRAPARRRLSIEEGSRIEMLDPDTAAFFTDRQAVNDALREMQAAA